MMFKIDTRLNQEEVDGLIERYFEGLTSTKEEQRLYSLLQHPRLEGKYDAERAMLGYFKNSNYHSRMAPLHFRILRVAAVAVLVVVGGVLSIQLLTPEVHASYAYVNGERTTDMSIIQSKALASMETLPSISSLVEESLREVSSKQLIQSQLNVFSDFE